MNSCAWLQRLELHQRSPAYEAGEILLLYPARNTAEEGNKLGCPKECRTRVEVGRGSAQLNKPDQLRESQPYPFRRLSMLL